MDNIDKILDDIIAEFGSGAEDDAPTLQDLLREDRTAPRQVSRICCGRTELLPGRCHPENLQRTGEDRARRQPKAQNGAAGNQDINPDMEVRLPRSRSSRPRSSRLRSSRLRSSRLRSSPPGNRRLPEGNGLRSAWREPVLFCWRRCCWWYCCSMV